VCLAFFRDHVPEEHFAWVVAPYILLFILLWVRPMIKIALGIILMVAPTVPFLCSFLGVVLAGIDFFGAAGFVIASHAALLGVAAMSFQHEYGTKTTWTLILIGGAIAAVSVGVCIWLFLKSFTIG
jgi:hypothetical protein